jgi:hypothetical protein
MSAGSSPRQDGSIPRVDSFEIIDFDCTSILSEEEKTWPVSTLIIRSDSFEVSESKSIESNTTSNSPEPR